MNRFKSTAFVVTSVCALFAIFAVTGTADTMHGTEHHDAPKGMKVSIKLKKDKKAGYNLFVRTKNFRWAPEHASGRHRNGEGHAHLMVDGKKLTRLYGSAFYLTLDRGRHKVTVSLNGNDHAPYMRGDKEIADSVTVTANGK